MAEPQSAHSASQSQRVTLGIGTVQGPVVHADIRPLLDGLIRSALDEANFCKTQEDRNAATEVLTEARRLRAALRKWDRDA